MPVFNGFSSTDKEIIKDGVSLGYTYCVQFEDNKGMFCLDTDPGWITYDQTPNLCDMKITACNDKGERACMWIKDIRKEPIDKENWVPFTYTHTVKWAKVK